MINSTTYEVNINNEMQELNRKAWKSLTEVNYIDPNLNISKDVCDGWMRSKIYKIDPCKKLVSKILTQDEVEYLKEKNAFFLEVSKPALENLINFVYHSGFTVAISDKSGILLHVFGDDNIIETIKEGNWIVGADWSEPSIGNNGIGTSLYSKKPVMIIGYEHYCRCCHHWASAASPILFNNDIVGSIALCGRFEKIHPHTLGMIIAAAHDIEMQLSIRKILHEREIAYKNQQVLVNAITDGVIGINIDGTITFCNKKTYDILDLKYNDLIGTNINAVMDRNHINLLYSTTNLSNEEILFNINGNLKRCVCSSEQIINSGTVSGTVLLIKDYETAVRMANKLIGLKTNWTFQTMIGKNKNHVEMVKVAKIASSLDKSILILGESGTGKDVFAQSIHNNSNRKNGPYIAINCGAIPKDLIASELFGYSEGAFTGAKKGGIKGKFEMANGGTLFLDEIGEMPLEQQVVLLRVLEDSSLNRIGSSLKTPIDVRIIAATSKNIIEDIKSHKFRQDLFYRLNVFTIKTIPLRERKDDIEELSNVFIQRSAMKTGRIFQKLNEEVLSILIEYNWPGNIRELQNVLERALAMSGDGMILPEMVNLGPLGIYSNNNNNNIELSLKNIENAPLIESLNEYEANLIKSELVKHNWNVTKTCEKLNVSRPTLYRWLKKFNIEIPRFKKNMHDII
jgi:transcriptional regulator with PAS, ATPase and Fis domain